MADYLHNAWLFIRTVCPVAVLILGAAAYLDYHRRVRP